MRSPTGKSLRRSALTVLEILIAATLSLVMILAMVQIFEVAGGAITEARASLELSARLRLTTMRMNIDLGNCTAPVRPVLNPRDGLGYFEIIDGPSRDIDADADGTDDVVQSGADMSAGDIDDVIMFTVQSIGEPFVGRVELAVDEAGARDGLIESNLAEIIWWTEFVDDDGDGVWDFGEDINVYRRVLLIRPDLDPKASAASAGNNLVQFYQNNDLSISNFTGTFVPNSLSSLTKRENRFAHNANFPHELNRTTLANYILQDSHLGEDVILSNVQAFDVRVYDSQALIRTDGNVALIPGDPGYATYNQASDVIGRGAYVDLRYGPTITPASFFSGAPNNVSNAPANIGMSVPTYCTWSTHYESNGLDEDNDGEGGSTDPITGLNQIDNVDNNSNGQFDELIDELVNGLDDDGAGGVDDANEQETSPPYPIALRGVKVIMRTLEIDSKQVRQNSVVVNFVPE